MGTKVVFALRSDPARTRDGDRRLVRLIALAYGALAIAGGTLAYFFAGGQPLAHPRPWFAVPGYAAAPLSAACGVALAFGVVLFTRVSVARYRWAKRLHLELSPTARRFDQSEIWLLALMSSLGEELFFRSFLTPTIGVFASTLLFGLLHQVRGPSRWVWAGWAFVVGLSFAALFAATGSIVGPILAHALVNGTNLGFLKAYNPRDSRSPLAQ
jgi:membrane protease YdiL (CAAX protease family)